MQRDLADLLTEANICVYAVKNALVRHHCHNIAEFKINGDAACHAIREQTRAFQDSMRSGDVYPEYIVLAYQSRILIAILERLKPGYKFQDRPRETHGFDKAYVLRDMQEFITECLKKKDKITQILMSKSCKHYVVGADLEFLGTCMRTLQRLKNDVSSLADSHSFSDEEMRARRLPFRLTKERLEAICSHCLDMDRQRLQERRKAQEDAAPTEQAVAKEQLHALLRRLQVQSPEHVGGGFQDFSIFSFSQKKATREHVRLLYSKRKIT
jgi:hypothetical protein